MDNELNRQCHIMLTHACKLNEVQSVMFGVSKLEMNEVLEAILATEVYLCVRRNHLLLFYVKQRCRVEKLNCYTLAFVHYGCEK